MNYTYYPYLQAIQPQIQQLQTQQQIQPQQSQQQIQNGGFISVRNITEAQNYPIAPGNSVTFKDENSPYVYVKTMGFSQLDIPTFEVFRLVKEDINQEDISCSSASEVDKIKQELDKLKDEVERLRVMVETELETDG